MPKSVVEKPPFRMEKVDLIPLEHMLVVAMPARDPCFPGLALWCRLCRQRLGVDSMGGSMGGSVIELVMMVRIADIHLGFECPRTDQEPDWSWHPMDDDVTVRARMQMGKTMQEEVDERVKEAMEAAKAQGRKLWSSL